MTALLMVSGESLVSAGLGGLAITYALSVTQSLNWMVRMASERETNIVSVERVKEYAEDIPREAEAIYEDHRPPPDWPQQGAIEFKNYQMRYRPGLPLVLKGINLSIRPGERVGIVGRTGAGKSSMLASLLRLVEPAGGVVEVDKIATTSIGLDDLRSKFSIIPQDPVLFTGTVRTNLDPFNERTDDELWEALERSHLSRKIREVEGGLEATVEEGGRNFSLGERQLICLARALLRKSKVLLLDEATSAVDQLTDKIIQTSIRTIFSGCTVMTIAHRIDTILDYDRIVVMDDGKIAEFDTPVNLFREDTIFRAMAESAGITDLPQGISAPTSGGGGSGVGMQSIETSFVNSAVHSSCTMNQPITQAN
uniref:ABC transporter domain-containing protein n=1 Tax=Vitrella brassicaformis TaxID=1169539 RepID=A0A7S1JR02_9ALVE